MAVIETKTEMFKCEVKGCERIQRMERPFFVVDICIRPGNKTAPRFRIQSIQTCKQCAARLEKRVRGFFDRMSESEDSVEEPEFDLADGSGPDDVLPDSEVLNRDDD